MFGCLESNNTITPPSTFSQTFRQLLPDENIILFRAGANSGDCWKVDGNKFVLGNCVQFLIDMNIEGGVGQIPFINIDGNALELGGIDFNKDTNTLMVHGQIFSDPTGSFDFAGGTFLVPVQNGFHSTTLDDGKFNVISVNEFGGLNLLGGTMGGLGFINVVDGTNDDSYRGPTQLYGVFGFNTILNKGYVSDSVGGEFQSNVGSESYVDNSVGVVSSVTNLSGSGVDNAIGVNSSVLTSGVGSAINTAYGFKADVGVLNSATIGTAYGLYIADVSTASSNYAIYTLLGDVSLGDDLALRNDNDKIWFGAGKDASITFNGTNLVINPKEVGSGVVRTIGRNVVGPNTTGFNAFANSYSAYDIVTGLLAINGNYVMVNPENIYSYKLDYFDNNIVNTLIGDDSTVDYYRNWLIDAKNIKINTNGGDGNVEIGTRLIIDGNVSIKSPSGKLWNCGVNNSGVFSCS